jgi:hydroxymethylglutaryl-CoA synthase
MALMKPNLGTGIIGYGVYIPQYRIPAREIARVWQGSQAPVPITEKAVPGPDEDTMTIGLEAARNALARAGVDPRKIGAVWVGSESHPYAVKPTSTIIAEALGITPATVAADWQFACKAGTETIQAGIGMVGSGMVLLS